MHKFKVLTESPIGAENCACAQLVNVMNLSVNAGLCL